MDRLPVGAVAMVAAQTRHDLLAEHDQTWVDPSFTSPLTGVVVRLMRDAGRVASLDPIDDARRFTDTLREARAALASCQLGLLDLGIEEAEVTDPQIVAVIQDPAAGRIGQLTPEQNEASVRSPRQRTCRSNSTPALRRTASTCPRATRTAAPPAWRCSGPPCRGSRP